MTYARARLWLGISGVGSLVVLAATMLVIGLPQTFLSTAETPLVGDITQMAAVVLTFVLWLLPFDVLGGFVLPKGYGKTQMSLTAWLQRYLPAVAIQTILFSAFGVLILAMSRKFGLVGSITAVTLGFVSSALLRSLIIQMQRVKHPRTGQKLVDALALIQSWEVFVPKTVVVHHEDVGFTGGILGWGKWARIVIPMSWLRFSNEQLAMAIARRALAIETGSYRRGITAALLWNLSGFLICSLMPGSTLTTVAGLATTICWFTLWTFVGLLTLPTLSRRASLEIDQTLRERGAPSDWILRTAFSMDQLQDAEPERPAFVEAIFHPIPSVARRRASELGNGLSAWNVARTTLFFSWGCLGLLARAVHCNIGRPELWTMLPSD